MTGTAILAIVGFGIATAVTVWACWEYRNEYRRVRGVRIQTEARIKAGTGWESIDRSREAGYQRVRSKMDEVRAMPVGPGGRFETEEQKQALLTGMQQGLSRVMDIDAELRAGRGKGDG